MIEGPNKEKAPESDTEQVADELSSGHVTEADFIEKMYDLDQRTPERKDAYENYRILKRPDIAERFMSSPEKDAYLKLLSLTCFHIGQGKAAVVGEDDTREGDAYPAQPFFIEALDAARQGGQGEHDASWQAYVEATVAYYAKDLPTLEHAIAGIQEDRNKQIALSLLAGLKKRGQPNYAADAFIRG